MKKTIKGVVFITTIMVIILSATFVLGVPDPRTFDGRDATVNTENISLFGQNIISVITTVGSIASVIVLVILGIKYMMGSAEEKAEYKKTLLPYIIGAILIFAASTIASVIFSMASSDLGLLS